MINNLEFILAVVGSFSVGYITFKGFKWVWVRRNSFKLRNPLKSYIRRQVVEYLKELKDE